MRASRCQILASSKALALGLIAPWGDDRARGRLLQGLGFEVMEFGSSSRRAQYQHRMRLDASGGPGSEVRALGLRVGVAFDGDGDRAIFVDHLGQIVDGDAVLLMCARQLKAEGRLKGNAVVATVMSNIGRGRLWRQRIELVRCAVGDKYVMEELIAAGLVLGGEQSVTHLCDQM